MCFEFTVIRLVNIFIISTGTATESKEVWSAALGFRVKPRNKKAPANVFLILNCFAETKYRRRSLVLWHLILLYSAAINTSLGPEFMTFLRWASAQKSNAPFSNLPPNRISHCFRPHRYQWRKRQKICNSLFSPHQCEISYVFVWEKCCNTSRFL